MLSFIGPSQEPKLSVSFRSPHFTQPPMWITNAMLFDRSVRRLRRGNILIVDDVIEKVKYGELSISDDFNCTIVDVNGRLVMIDMQCNIRVADKPPREAPEPSAAHNLVRKASHREVQQSSLQLGSSWDLLAMVMALLLTYVVVFAVDDGQSFTSDNQELSFRYHPLLTVSGVFAAAGLMRKLEDKLSALLMPKNLVGNRVR